MLDFLFPDWIESVMQESEKEAKEELEWPTLLLRNNTRKLVWTMSTALGVDKKGVPGAACRLMEKYLPRYIKVFIDMFGPEQWQRHKAQIEKQFALFLMSCIQLSAKMYMTSSKPYLTIVRDVLLRNGFVYTENQIRDSEFHVFKTLGFVLPKWTNMDTAQFLIKMIDVVDPKLVEAVDLMINIADYNINFVEKDIQAANGPISTENGCYKKSILNVHLCAGAVLASLRYMSAFNEEHTTKLAKLTRTTTTYINAIADGILKYLKMRPINDGRLSVPKTRKRSHEDA